MCYVSKILFNITLYSLIFIVCSCAKDRKYTSENYDIVSDFVNNINPRYVDRNDTSLIKLETFIKHKTSEEFYLFVLDASCSVCIGDALQFISILCDLHVENFKILYAKQYRNLLDFNLKNNGFNLSENKRVELPINAHPFLMLFSGSAYYSEYGKLIKFVIIR